MMTPGIYQQLLQQIQGGGAQGFMQPGNMAPQLPQAGMRGASGGMPAMPSAFGANGGMNGQGTPGGGMFSQLMQNPQMMQMLKGMQSNAPESMGPQRQSGDPSPNSVSNWGMQPGQQGAPDGGQMGPFPQQGGLQALLQRLMGGNA